MTHPLPMHGARPEPAARPRLTLAARGFRTFFLLAVMFAAAIVPVWLLILRGVLRVSMYLDPVSWHAHEMIYGFVVAVIAGFLLTAVVNWTQRETIAGAPLLALAGLWALGRIVMACAHALPRGLPAVVDLMFLPVLSAVLARPLIATKNRRNFVMLALLAALFGANVVVHLEALGQLARGSARYACLAALDVVLLMISIMAGRVFPMFTRNATRVASIRSIVWLDIASAVAMALLTVFDVVLYNQLAAATAGVAAVLSAARARHWGAQYSWRQPLVWILHAGYAWLVFGLALRAVAGFTGAISASLATHALTVGAIGSITLGMMARVALGHTGRFLVTSPAVVWAFAAVNAAAIARVFIPWAAPGWYFTALITTGVLWTLAFTVFLVVYTPLLSAPRVDGKAG